MVKEMSVLDGNKLIAEFMGGELNFRNFGPEIVTVVFSPPLNVPFLDYNDDGGFIATELNYCSEQELEFHSDWNWLMPVVEKIESMGYGCKSYLGSVEFSCCGDFETFWPIGLDKKQSTYQAVIEFIKWYNRANKN